MRAYWLTLLLLGCGPKDGEDSGAGASDCAGDIYVDGITKDGVAGLYAVEIVAANPAPPDKGDNSWTLRIQGADAADIASVVAEPEMPQHGHGTTPATFAGTAVGDGTWEVEPFDLFMPGYWEIAVEVTDTSGQSDLALFAFCVEG